MIYFFDNELNMVKVATSKNVISAVHEHELNGLILGTVEADLSYTEAFINDVDYFGYYYKDNYYLHKIKRVEHEHENELVRITGRHIFFEDMLYGDYIRDVRPVNRDALYILNQTISANTRWQTVMTDTSKLHSETYYWVPPMEVLNDLTENVGIEYEPKILFDGQNINGFQLHVANRIGEDTPIRVPFGSRAINLKYEVDYSEIVTALYGHGKGEEVGDGYGRRINFSDIDFSKDGVVSPSGQLYMENPNVTAQYGKDDGSPKFGRAIFEDIESTSELANATYEAYLEQSRPKMLFEASVVDLGDVGMGDGVLIIRREYDVYFNARIHKLMVDLLDAENADVELGDYAHFKESKVQRKTRENNNQYRRETSSRIQQLKEQFNDRFDGEVNQMREDFEQALIDAHAEIQAAEERMETLIEYERDTMMNEFNESVQNTRAYAEQQAQEKATAVRTDLETVTSGHQSMLDDLESNVMNIDDFLGPRDRTLQLILDEQRAEIEQKIEVYSRNYPNLQVGTTFENIQGWRPWQGTAGELELRTDESLNFVRVYPGTSDSPSLESMEYIYLENNKKYVVAVDFRSDVVEDLDNSFFLHPNGNIGIPSSQTRGLIADGNWHRYYFNIDMVGRGSGNYRLLLGTNFLYGDTNEGIYDIRQIHVYEGEAHNIPWTPSPSDNAQVVSQLLYEMRQLEDGMSTLATKTEVDLLTGDVTQLTNEYLSTSEQVSSKLQKFDDVLGVNGSHFTQIADQVQSKVWMNDFTDINPNLIPFADVKNLSDMYEYWNRFGTNSSGSHANALDSDGFYVFRDTVAESNLALESATFEEIKEGEQYTLSFLAKTHSNINDNYNYTFIINPSGSYHNLGMWTNRKHIRDNIYLYEWIFEARWTGEARVLIGSNTTPGTDASIRFKEPKLERGSVRTPFLNAFSNIEQLANKIALQVQELDGEYLSQSDIEIQPGYVQLGSQRLGDSQLASIFRVSPNSIDAITSNLNLSGNLNTKGQITALAVDAIEGDFARLWAAEFSAITIDVDDIQGFTARFEYLYTLNANIEKLVSQTAFINEINALSLDAVYGNISELRTELLTSNVILSRHVNASMALIDKIFSEEAYIERLTSKSAFIRDIQAIEITANQLNLTTLKNRFNKIGGGLHIRRPDGGMLINNGVLENTFAIQFIQPRFEGVGVEWSANYYKTTNTSYTTAAAFSYLRGGRYLTVEGYCEMRGDVAGAADTTVGAIRLLEYSSGTRSSFTIIESRKTNNGNNQFFRIRLDLGVPQYEQRNFYVQFYTAHSGNAAYFRINQAYYHG